MAGALITPAGDDSPKDYPGKLTWYVFVTCIVAAMGGLIFGYDIGISVWGDIDGSVGVADVQAEFNDLVDASAASKEVEHPWRDLSMRKYRPQLCLAILIPMFQQLTGINVVMFYAPVLFKTIGFQSNASLASAMIAGGVNVLATFISVFGTDRWGR
ncbi:unnamed protein product [Camellia sinensis]